MNEDKLVRMANQMATYFRSFPEEEGAAGIRGHLKAYWTRNMIRDLKAHVAGGAGGIDPLVAHAMVDPPMAESPVAQVQAGPDAGGLMVTDAG